MLERGNDISRLDRNDDHWQCRPPDRSRDYRLSTFTDDPDAPGEPLRFDQWWVVGHSWGGGCGQDYLAHPPERCLGAILLRTLIPADPTKRWRRSLRGRLPMRKRH